MSTSSTSNTAKWTPDSDIDISKFVEDFELTTSFQDNLKSLWSKLGDGPADVARQALKDNGLSMTDNYVQQFRRRNIDGNRAIRNHPAYAEEPNVAGGRPLWDQPEQQDQPAQRLLQHRINAFLRPEIRQRLRDAHQEDENRLGQDSSSDADFSDFEDDVNEHHSQSQLEPVGKPTLDLSKVRHCWIVIKQALISEYKRDTAECMTILTKATVTLQSIKQGSEEISSYFRKFEKQRKKVLKASRHADRPMMDDHKVASLLIKGLRPQTRNLFLARHSIPRMISEDIMRNLRTLCANIENDLVTAGLQRDTDKESSSKSDTPATNATLLGIRSVPDRKMEDRFDKLEQDLAMFAKRLPASDQPQNRGNQYGNHRQDRQPRNNNRGNDRVCDFHSSPRGCFKGSQCAFRHEGPSVN